MDGWIAHFGQWVWPHLNIIHMFYLLQVIKRAVSPKKLRSKNYVLILYEVNSSNKYILKIKLHPKHSSKYLVWNKWKSGWNLKLATLHWDGCIVHWDTFLQTPISEPHLNIIAICRACVNQLQRVVSLRRDEQLGIGFILIARFIFQSNWILIIIFTSSIFADSYIDTGAVISALSKMK